MQHVQLLESKTNAVHPVLIAVRHGTTRMSIDTGMWYIYTAEDHSAIKKHEVIPSAATSMVLGIMILTEKSDRERQISYDVRCMWNLK